MPCGVSAPLLAVLTTATGATTCNLVHVAAGEVDMSFDAGCWAWDVAVGDKIP